MKKLFFTILFLFGVHFLSIAQEPMQAVYLELGGNGWVYTINYEHSIKYKPSSPKLRYGVGYLKVAGIDIVNTPITISSLRRLRKRNNYAEIGVGINTLWTHENGKRDISLALTSIFGYRYQNDSWMFKAAFTPFYSVGTLYTNEWRRNSDNSRILSLWGGIGVGYRFY